GRWRSRNQSLSESPSIVSREVAIRRAIDQVAGSTDARVSTPPGEESDSQTRNRNHVVTTRRTLDSRFLHPEDAEVFLRRPVLPLGWIGAHWLWSAISRPNRSHPLLRMPTRAFPGSSALSIRTAHKPSSPIRQLVSRRGSSRPDSSPEATQSKCERRCHLDQVGWLRRNQRLPGRAPAVRSMRSHGNRRYSQRAGEAGAPRRNRQWPCCTASFAT